ncbi:Mis12 protein-domain-containing protein [Xylaria intraflava]|nr:Mis12 protein-domain-containing protein [Xylaria intraflava]
MATTPNSEAELLTEHFGYPPVSLIDDIINSINILAERALNSVEQGLVNAPPAALGFKAPKSQSAQSQQDAANAPSPAERAKEEIEAGTHQLETLLCASIDRNFDKFELYVLRNILTVNPPELCNWIRLSHYDGLDFSSSPSVTRYSNGTHSRQKDAPTIESITLLRRRLRESMRLNALLTAERAQNDALLQDLRRLIRPPATGPSKVKAESASPAQRRSTQEDTNTNTADGQNATDGVSKREELKSPFAFLHQKGDLASSGGGAAPLATTAAFTLSQMQALRALSTALGNLTPDLKGLSASRAPEDQNAEGPKGPASWRRERVEYVETATRRHLEIIHGLELGKHGEVRDGEWQGSGRNLARGEVEGLEQVVSLIHDSDDDKDGPAEADAPAREAEEDTGRMDES